jgi:hypothetical protein
VAAEFPVKTTWIPAGFSAGVWAIHDDVMRVGGLIPREHRDSSWLDAAKPADFDPAHQLFYPAGTALRPGIHR